VAGDDRSDEHGDIAPDELTGYCLNALNAAAGPPSPAAVQRLVRVTLAGLRLPWRPFGTSG
jgi:hypothetical protein